MRVLLPIRHGSTILHTARKLAANPLIRKLESIFTLSGDERQALEDLPMQVTTLKENQTIVREGDRPSRACLLLEGFNCTYKVTGSGKRQIMSFNVPGDLADLQSLHLEVMDASVATITPCIVGFIDHAALRDICGRYPRIAAAFWRETLIDAAIYREWVMNVGRREATSRMAHLLCEIVVRLRAVGLAREDNVELPITQVELADALGLSTVHVNRVAQKLRADGLIELKDERLAIPDWEKLKQVGDFDPTYLHLKTEEAAA